MIWRCPKGLASLISVIYRALRANCLSMSSFDLHETECITEICTFHHFVASTTKIAIGIYLRGYWDLRVGDKLFKLSSWRLAACFPLLWYLDWILLRLAITFELQTRRLRKFRIGKIIEVPFLYLSSLDLRKLLRASNSPLVLMRRTHDRPWIKDKIAAFKRLEIVFLEGTIFEFWFLLVNRFLLIQELKLHMIYCQGLYIRELTHL